MLDLLPFHQSFAEHEQHLKSKTIFLNSVFLMAGVVAFGMGFYRWQHSHLMGAIDFGFFIVCVALLYYLKRHKEKIELISSIAISLSFILFFAIYLLATYNTMRLSLFFLLAAAAFYLKGRRAGLVWLIFILLSIVLVHLLPSFSTDYSHIDITTTCLYLIALFLIFWNYEKLKEDLYRREQEYTLQIQLDQRWRMALEGAGDAMWDWNLNTHAFQYSSRYAAMLGYENGELGDDARLVPTLLHPQDAALAVEHLRHYLAGELGEHYVSEQRMRCQDGSYKWILCRGSVVMRNADGRPARMIGTHMDITDHLRIEASLKESEMRLNLALGSAKMGVWDYDLRTHKLFWSPEVFRLFGKSYFEPTLEDFFNLVHPNNGEYVQASMEKCILEHIPLFVEFRVVDGVKQFWVEARGEIQYDDASEPTRVIGTLRDITERKEHEKQLEHIAHYDALTGVPNRVLLADRLAQSLAHTKREQRLMAVCHLDLDGFKPVNDSFGHEAGDHVLVEITRRIKESIREDDTVARLGGDEFVVLLVGLQVPEECVSSLNRLLTAINRPIEVNGKTLNISASIGVSLYPEDEQDADTLLRHADQAMYVAKQSGKNRYHLFDAANDLRARSHHELLQQIRHGLACGEFDLYYQPKVEMCSRRLVGVEALIRWHHPQRGLLVPGEFLRIIENTELEIELGDWVISRALDQLGQWRQAGMQIELSLNASAYHLQSDGFALKLKDKMQSQSAQPCQGCLQIEVLETAALEDMVKVGAIIKECKEFGVGFALDDFGTGYSSLTYLSNLAVDTLKIDQSFVRDMLDDKGDHAIVQGIIALAKAFDMSVVAEGVENDALYQVLLQMGCEIGQGFVIARPMPAAELANWSMA